MLLNTSQVSGQLVSLKTTDPRHITDSSTKTSGNKEIKQSFGDVLMNAFTKVNDLQRDTEQLTQKMITDPDEVNVNDVMISMAESSLAINMAKNVVNRAIQAYKEIIGVR
jgi:flagellar hook-basal body complex protein FliE